MSPAEWVLQNAQEDKGLSVVGVNPATQAIVSFFGRSERDETAILNSFQSKLKHKDKDRLKFVYQESI